MKTTKIPSRLSQYRLARLLTHLFPEMPVSRRGVQAAQREGILPPGNENGLISVRKSISAWRIFLAAGDGSAGGNNLLLFLRADQAEARSKIREEERREIEFQELKNQYVKKSDSAAARKSFAAQYFAQVKFIMSAKVKARAEFCRSLGMSPELLQKVMDLDVAWAQDALTELETFARLT